MQVPKSSQPQAPPVGSIIGGNWSFAVSKGVLQNFKWDATTYKLDGSANGTLSINELTNSTGALKPSPTNAIVLRDNNTVFKGNANININGKTAFSNVPVVVFLLKGKLVNFSISATKTNNFFLLPLFGIVTSLTKSGGL